ncbi:MAG: ABC transporter permease [Lewinellaceae bacterium]|nr:ABC transporter permease [Saprospiraceae bacterium]MCB9344675.1 ABC transporter permease [Lewinellaceae bacterium]
MLLNYITIAIRNLRKHPLYSGLNIVGLALGIAACLLIFLYLAYETSYDNWNDRADRTVRVASDINYGGSQMGFAVAGAVIGPDCGRELPEVQSWCRFRNRGSYLVRREGELQSNIREEDVLTVDSSFFEVFPVKVLQGDPLHCLTQPNSIAISRSRAEKFFSSPQLAMGQTLMLENEDRRLITAVFEDMPQNTHFRADLLLSLVNDQEVQESPPFWGMNNNFQTYLLLRKGTDKVAFSKKFEQLARQKIAITAQQVMGFSLEEFEKTGQYAHFYLQNIPDIHLHSDLTAELAVNGNIRYVWVFSAIALFILLIACINFMNLATARSSMRAREIGVRKVLGGTRTGLMGQFLTESILVSALSVGLALLLATMVMAPYNELTGRDLSIPWAQPLFWLTLAGGAGLVGLLAGSYPAFFLSAFNAVQVVKGDPSGPGRKKVGFRSVLVVFQFSISVVLILATILVFKQLHYIQTKSLGFQKSQVIILDDAYALGDRIYAFKNEILQNPAIESATVSGYLPVPSSRSDMNFFTSRVIEVDNTVDMQRWRVDSDYFKTMGMDLQSGRFFDPAIRTDSSAVIINEAAAKLFGFDDPLGKKIYTLDNTPGSTPKPEDFKELEVIGVVRNFHWESLRSNIGPLCFQLGRSRGLASFRYTGKDTEAVIASLEKEWKSLAPDQPFSFRFLDDAFNRMYRAEQRIGTLAGLFALLSVIISCLGLFGLSAFTAEQRTKEIGIRKVLGASVLGITSLLTKDFLKLVVIAILIASPLSYYLMGDWLSDFAYRIDIQWWMFATAAVIAVIIAIVTVSLQSIKAALANPVKSLRNE